MTFDNIVIVEFQFFFVTTPRILLYTICLKTFLTTFLFSLTYGEKLPTFFSECKFCFHFLGLCCEYSVSIAKQLA